MKKLSSISLVVVFAFTFLGTALAPFVSSETLYRHLGLAGLNISQQETAYVNTSGELGGRIDLGDGHVLILWSDDRNGASPYSIYAQKVTYEGVPVWEAGGRTLISSATSLGDGSTLFPGEGRVQSDYNGGFYLGYYTTDDLTVDHFTSEGTSDWLPVQIADIRGAVITTDPAGNVLVAGYDAVSDDIEYSTYSRTKVLLSSGTIDHLDGADVTLDGLTVEAGATGEFYIGWRSNDVGSDSMRIRKVPDTWAAPDGLVIGTSTFEADTDRTFFNIHVSNNYVVAVWRDLAPVDPDVDIKMQIIDKTAGTNELAANGQVLAADVVVPNTLEVLIDTSESIYVSWLQDVQGSSMIQKYNTAGVEQWNGGTPFNLSTDISRFEGRGSLFQMGSDIYLRVTYYDEDDDTEGLTLYRLETDGTNVWPGGKQLTYPTAPDMAAYIMPREIETPVIDGKLFSYWIQYDFDDYYEKIYMNIFEPGYQIANLDADLAVEVSGVSVEDDTENSHVDTQTTRILNVSPDRVLADVSVAYSTDRDWSLINGGVDEVLGKTFVSGLGSAPGVVGTFTMYTPKILGDTGVRVCPGVTSLASTNTSCTSGYYLEEGDAGLSVVNIDGIDYWAVSGLSGTGIMSLIVPVVPPEDPVDPEEPIAPVPTQPIGDSAPIAPVSGPVSFPQGSESGIGEDGEDEENEENLLDSSGGGSESSGGLGSFTQVDGVNVLTPVVAATVLLASVSAITGGAVNYVALFFGFWIGKKSKYWGIVYDSKTFKPLALVTVRLFAKTSMAKKFVAQTVTNFDGVYGIPSPASGEYVLEFVSEGYETTQKIVSYNRGEDIAVDVILRKLVDSEAGLFNSVRIFFKEHYQFFLQLLRFAIVIFMGYGFITSYSYLSLTPSVLNLVVTALYFVVFVVQLYYILKRSTGWKYGQVRDVTDKKPLPGTAIRLDTKDGQQKISLSNQTGQVKFQVAPEVYKYSASKVGYEYKEDSIRIDDSGKFIGSIDLFKGASSSASPFGS